MTVDQVARDAGARLRHEVTAATSSADVESSLRTFHDTASRRVRRRTPTRLLAVAATLAAVAGGGAYLARSDAEDPGPAAPDTSCSTSDLLRCAEDGRVTVDGPVTYGFTVIPGFAEELEPLPSGNELVVYASSRPAGVTFLVDPEAVVEGVGGDAESLARWVASRPFLRTDTVEVDVGGRQAWQVDVELRPGRALDRARSCDGEVTGSPCHALLRTPDTVNGESGPWTGMVSRFLFVGLPGGHTFVAWAWSFDHDRAAMELNGLLIGTVGFEQATDR
jgi:hypothetical protein